jgi:hypothetical protein
MFGQGGTFQYRKMHHRVTQRLFVQNLDSETLKIEELRAIERLL